MSATPAWLPGYAPLFIEAASSYRYSVRRFSMYCALTRRRKSPGSAREFAQ